MHMHTVVWTDLKLLCPKVPFLLKWNMREHVNPIILIVITPSDFIFAISSFEIAEINKFWNNYNLLNQARM